MTSNGPRRPRRRRRSTRPTAWAPNPSSTSAANSKAMAAVVRDETRSPSANAAQHRSGGNHQAKLRRHGYRQPHDAQGPLGGDVAERLDKQTDRAAAGPTSSRGNAGPAADGPIGQPRDDGRRRDQLAVEHRPQRIAPQTGQPPHADADSRIGQGRDQAAGRATEDEVFWR